MEMKIPVYKYADKQFFSLLKQRIQVDDAVEDQGNVEVLVDEIIQEVKRKGDEAVLQYTKQFDGLDLASSDMLEIKHERLQRALELIPQEQRHALEVAAKRITRYHEKQKKDLQSWQFEDE